MYPMEWRGREDGKSGTVKFIVDGNTLEIGLRSLEDAYAINKTLEMAFEQGKRFAVETVTSGIEAKLKEYTDRFCG